MFRTADAPTKANNSFLLSLGLVNIPLAVLTGTESTKVERKEFVQVGDAWASVGRAAINKADGKLVEASDIVRQAQATNGEWVILTDDEIAEATMPKGVAEVIAFIPAAKLRDAYVTEKVDQVRAKTSGLKAAQVQAAERAFGLFLAGLKSRKVVALVKVALRGPARYAGITADGDLLWLHPSDAIRQPKPLTPVVLSDQELSLIGQLIDSYPKAVKPLLDESAVAVQAYVDAKAGNGGNVVTDLPEPELVAGGDMLAALHASIDAQKAKVTA